MGGKRECVRRSGVSEDKTRETASAAANERKHATELSTLSISTLLTRTFALLRILRLCVGGEGGQSREQARWQQAQG
jgi:hypothetical protein